MGLFDVGSLRSRKSGARNVSLATDYGNMDNVGTDRLTHHSSFSARSLSLGLPESSRSLQPQRSVSGLASTASRQSKLERMMGAGVPNVEVLPRQPRSSGVTSLPLAEAHPSHRGLNNYAPRSSFNPDSDTSQSRSFASDLSLSGIRASSTFTELIEVDCPVCLEPLSHRLAGEKPHVIPSCGHALHNACFIAIYGAPEAILAAQNVGGRILSNRTSSGPPGMCGVCRKPILLGGSDASSKSHKLAGIASANANAGPRTSNLIDLAHQDDSLYLLSAGRSTLISSAASTVSSSSITHTRPNLRPKPEFPTIYGKRDSGPVTKINVVSVLTVEVPNRRSAAELRDQTLDTIVGEGDELSRREDEDSFSDDLKRSGSRCEAANEQSRSNLARARASNEIDSLAEKDSVAPVPDQELSKAVLDDLQTRMGDWKGHSIEHFGPLILHNILNIRQQSVVREFHVYLFQEALLCVTEDKTKTVPQTNENPAEASTQTAKPPLKLKGRIYLRHIRRAFDSSSASQHSVSITMDDENLDQFVLCFQETATLSIWISRLTALIEPSKKAGTAAEANRRPTSARGSGIKPSTSSPVAVISRDTSAAASVLSGKTGSQLSQNRFARPLSNVSSQPSHGSGVSRSDAAPAYQQWSMSGGLDPRLSPPHLLSHTPLDLVLMISVPAVLTDYVSGSINSSAALKLRLIRSTLDFVVHNLGPQDRISLVTFSIGGDGEVKRTGLLSPHREPSRGLLERFIEEIGRPRDGDENDPFAVELSALGGSSDRVDSVTAVNVGLDVVLGRKTKNGVTGMMLINDMSDGPKRNQMDLVLARAEAANVAIHCFGYGKTHDPSSLWLISNHTRGSYTFVREWHQLRECVAGCVGSMMSVALTDAKIHISVPEDNQFRVRKIAGLPGAIISASGKNVDIELGELKFGESKDLLIELELDLARLLPKLNASRSESKSLSHGPSPFELGSATDDFMQRMGIEDLSLEDSDGTDVYLDQLVEEVGVFEADVSFKDPATGTTTSRLANPGILTLEIDTHNTDPLSKGQPGLAAMAADPTVTRRRLEVLVSEMMTRSLLFASRKNHGQALKVITETRRIVDTVVQALNGTSAGPVKRRSTPTRSNQRRQREWANQQTITSLMAMMSDLDVLSDSLDQQNRSTFDRDGRNFGAQQAMVLRDQKAWTTRSDSEHFYFRSDNAAALVAWSAAYTSRQ